MTFDDVIVIEAVSSPIVDIVVVPDDVQVVSISEPTVTVLEVGSGGGDLSLLNFYKSNFYISGGHALSVFRPIDSIDAGKP